MLHIPDYDVDALLTDGLIAHLRCVRSADRKDLVDLFDFASEDSRYRRFFSANPVVAHQFVERLCGDNSTAYGLLASVHGVVVGLATAEEIDAGRAEVSVFVTDTLHGHGLGTLLLEHLAGIMRSRGAHTLVADVLASNSPMLRVFGDAGFETEISTRSSEARVVLKTRLTTAAGKAAAARERISERASLQGLLEPSSVAVVGVSRSRGSVGREILENVRASGYQGRTFAIGRHQLEIQGVESVKSLADIDGGIDLVVVAVPASGVATVLRDAADAGAKGCLIVTSGLGEEGPDGRALQERLVSIARSSNMRIIGPNCLGLMSLVRGTSLDATFAKATPQPGTLAVASQSGGVGLAILDEATKHGVGIASFVSLGNKADVSGNDLLAAWSDDPDVEAIALYLESFGNPYKFLQLARTCSERKPIVAVFGGSSEAGRRAGLSHTAASLTPWRFLQALCEAAGVIAVSSPQDLVGTASLLLDQPLPAGRRLAIVGNVGGLGIVAADLAQADGLDIASLPTSVETTLGEVDGVAATANPVDLGAAATPELFATAVREALAVDDVDAVVAIVAATAVTDVEAVLDRFEECAAAAPRTPLLVVVVGTPAARRDPLTFFGAVEDAVAALAGAVSYSSWLGRAKPEQVQDDARIEKLRHRAKVLSASMESTGWIDLQTTFELLDSVNIPLPPWRMITSADEATEAAETLGYPLVAKACPTGTIHKSDAGLVIAQISDVALLDAAVRELARRAGESETILLQSQASPGVELALGIVQEPDVGPLLMIATGGVNVDVWGDQSFLVPPVSDEQVRRVLRRLRSWPLLQGHRGRPPADIDAFVKLTLRVSDLAVGVPEIKELDLNPVIVGGDGATCVDARIRIGDTSMMMDGMPALSPAMRSRHGRVDGSTDVRRTDAGG